MTSAGSGRGRRPGGTDVARLAGVSQKTVSRVFNNEPTVTDATRDRVLDAAQRLGYRPNGAARALLTGRTYRIGVVSLGTAHFGPSSLLVALEREARSINYSLSIANSFGEDSSGLAAAMESLLAQGVDAIILSEPVEDGDEPLVSDVPVLTFGTAPAVQAPTLLSVHAAEGGDAAAEVTRYLLGLGHSTVHHIAGPQRWWAGMTATGANPSPSRLAGGTTTDTGLNTMWPTTAPSTSATRDTRARSPARSRSTMRGAMPPAM